MAVADADELASRIWALRSGERRFMVDFRPHTHHWEVMRDVRATPTESGVLDLAGARLCMFMTTWGDGHYPIWAGLDADGGIQWLVIEMGYDPPAP